VANVRAAAKKEEDGCKRVLKPSNPVSYFAASVIAKVPEAIAVALEYVSLSSSTKRVARDVSSVRLRECDREHHRDHDEEDADGPER
jgi:hypothetical protein